MLRGFLAGGHFTRSQSAGLFYDGELQADIVFKFEALDTVARFLDNVYYDAGSQRLELPPRPLSWRDQEGGVTYYPSVEEIALVHARFRADFDRFGYARLTSQTDLTFFAGSTTDDAG